jgi:hypothetical protein
MTEDSTSTDLRYPTKNFHKKEAIAVASQTIKKQMFTNKLLINQYKFMKKIFRIIIFCGTTIVGFAQNGATTSVVTETANWPNTLSNLNTSQITSGVLIDKVSDFVNITTFNNNKNNLSSAEHFSQALTQLYKASDETRFISNTELKNRSTTTINNIVDIGIINTSFQKLYFNPENPAAAGLLVQNGKFVPVANKPSFVTKKIIVAAPLTEMATGKDITFNFKTNLIFNNATTNIKTLVVDFGTGVNNTIISNGAILTASKTIAYTNGAIKVLKFVFTFSDNSVITTYASLSLNYIDTTTSLTAMPSLTTNSCTTNLREQILFSSTLPYKGYDEVLPFFGKIQATIFYHNNNGNTEKKILKPIIVVDGFDPKDARKTQDCDCENDDNPDDKLNCRKLNSDITVTWGNGFFPTITQVFNPKKHESIEELMDYLDGTIDPQTGLPRKSNLITQLRSKGYDVIIINNPTYTGTNTAGQSKIIDGGADYIERNAMNLVSYMQSIQQKLIANGSSEKLVLLGPSMGGQITRYALAYMEKKFAETGLDIWKHNARLWVSVDSPHLGANIPVGAQANIWFLSDKLFKLPARISFYEKLNSVAGKQMVISQFKNALDTSTDGQGSGGYLNNSTFFTTYYNNLNTNVVAGSNGYPVTTSTFRKIAMVNGSLSGKKDAAPGATFYHTNSYIKANWLGFISPLAGLGALLSGQDIKIPALNLKLNFMPQYGTTAGVFGGDGQNFDIGFNHWNISHPGYYLSVNNNDSRGSLDVVSGGYFKTAKLIREDVEKGLKDAGANIELYSYIENHSFIPVFSALGHLQPNQDWGNALNSNLTCPSNKLTPFDSYYGIENNTEHVSFTKEAADWLYKELDSNTSQAPYFPVSTDELAGSKTICLNTNTNYSFADFCKIPSTVASWTVSDNLQIVSQNGTSIVVSGIYGGLATITANFSNSDQKLTKEIWISTPEFKEFTFDNSPYTLCIAAQPTSSYYIRRYLI